MKRKLWNLKPCVLALVGILLVAMMFTFQSLAAENDAVVPASRIIDQDVYDQNEEIIGEVEDIVIR